MILNSLGSVIDAVAKADEKTSFVSMSNTPYYFTAPIEQDYLQMMKANLEDSAHVVSRDYMRVPEKLDTNGYHMEKNRYEEIIASEKLQMYDIRVYVKS